jgi:hypothetical protein
MKTKWIVVTTLALTVLVVIALAGVGWWFVGRNIWGGAVQAQGPGGRGPGGMMGGYGRGGMMGGYRGPLGGPQVAPGTTTGQPLTIEQAQEAVERYVSALGYSNLVVDEVMEFSRNYYAIVKESDTGIGAMELLVDKYSGAVGPEYGPNMMWNAKYGMMGRMMGGRPSGRMAVTPEEALKAAQRWLDTAHPRTDGDRSGVVTESQADAFYGYYTIHTLKDGVINGMLSVNGSTGQVWYHTWHGEFIQMIGEEER